MLLDSNIIIYAIQPDFSQLRELIAEHSPAVSAVSYVEVLGYLDNLRLKRFALIRRHWSFWYNGPVPCGAEAVRVRR